jgi:hypothetical protein
VVNNTEDYTKIISLFKNQSSVTYILLQWYLKMVRKKYIIKYLKNIKINNGLHR